jgi:RNA polymerase sigma factor (sigma-70 family)
MNRYEGVDEKIVLSVRRHARSLKRMNMLRSMEVEDIEQELMYEVFSCLQKFDKRQGSIEHFIRKILERRSFNLLRDHLRTKRGPFAVSREYIESDNSYRIATNDAGIELNWLIKSLPNEYKTLCQLLKNHSVAEVAKILGKSRMSLYRELKEISFLANHRSNPKNIFLSTINEGAHMKNLSVLETLTAKEIGSLKINELMDLSDQVAKLVSHTKELKEKLEDGLNLRFSEAVKNNLRSENKDTGTTRFFDGAFQIVAEVPKKVAWDAEKMEELIKRIPDERRKDIVKISYSIEERKYSALPYEYQELFREARMVTPGKTKFQISIGENL